MCLILLSWKTHPKYKLIIAANRDEFYARPTAPADYWKDFPNLLAGKDKKAGGTWLGIEKRGRFAAVTNYRDLTKIKEKAVSRGNLTKDYLAGTEEPLEYLKAVSQHKEDYNGFNLLIGNKQSLYYYSNIEDQIKELGKGVYGLSNHLLDSAWPKVETGKEMFKTITRNEVINTEEIFKLLQNVDQPEDARLPATGVPLSLERDLSSIFIKMPEYGTYCSTVILLDDKGEVFFEERTFRQGQKDLVKKYNFGLYTL